MQVLDAMLNISIHALREEGDTAAPTGAGRGQGFLSTPSARRATKNPLSVVYLGCISIHALREEGDPGGCSNPDTAPAISIHALREEGDWAAPSRLPQPLYFYPRPPRGGRQNYGGSYTPKEPFLSTPSARRATCNHQGEPTQQAISIHALREEGDPRLAAVLTTTTHFYPRPPRGGRPVKGIVHLDIGQFLSTPSARRATHGRCRDWQGTYISIHALREEGDRWTHSSGGGNCRISIHALREEGDEFWFSNKDLCVLFLSTPSARRATLHRVQTGKIQRYFYPRPPRGGRHALPIRAYVKV